MIIGADSPLAQDVTDLVDNAGTSAASLPGIVTGGGYILATIFGSIGLVKLKAHVEAPTSVELKIPVINLLISGALLALPTMYDVFQNTINPVDGIGFREQDSNVLSEAGNALARIPFSMNAIFGNIGTSLSTLPGLATGVSYLLGIVAGIAALLKLKAHVETSGQVALKESVIRALISGAFLTIPFIFEVVFTTVADDGDTAGMGLGVMGANMLGLSSEGGACPVNLFSNSLGGVICRMWGGTLSFPLLVKSFAYICGIFVAIWGLLKVQEHVLKPDQVTVWEGVSRLLVAGALFALPTMMSVIYNTVAGFVPVHTNTGVLGSIISFFTGGPAAGGGGLDAMLGGLMADIFGPMTVLINWFGFIAGGVLIFIGITRLMKSAQEGARGPGGIGTIITFAVGGALIAFSPMITALTTSLFINPVTTVQSELIYTAGLEGDEIARIQAVVDAIIKFVYILGLISVMRGFFIMRKVAEGDSQASTMAGMTHMIGGAIAVNLGPMIVAVQNTLGITNIGLGFG